MKIVCASLLLASVFGEKAFLPTKVSFDDLMSMNEKTTLDIESGLTQVGLISVNNIPGFKKMRADMLNAASSCALAAKNSEASLTSVMDDHTSRLTLATQTIGETSEGFSGFDESHEDCQEFNSLNGKFRDLFSQTISAFVEHVDTILGTNENGRKLMLDTETNIHLSSMKEVVEEGLQLEHFHTYHKPANMNGLKKGAMTKPMHVDQGLFIALTPAESSTSSHGFLIELPNGEVSEPDFGEHNDEIVLMMGDGFHQWISPKVEKKFRPVPHAVEMPESGKESIRSWYGKMILPKPSAFLDTQEMTFGELRKIMMQGEMNEVTASVCSNELSLTARQLQECSEGEVLCWTFCQSPSDTCEDDEVATCVNATDSSDCDGTTHTFGACVAECVETESPTQLPTTSPTTSSPTDSPTTSSPSDSPTTSSPSDSPITSSPTTTAPSDSPTTSSPTDAPTTSSPTDAPITSSPTDAPITSSPTTTSPTDSPLTSLPTSLPTDSPTLFNVSTGFTHGWAFSYALFAYIVAALV